MSQLCSSSWLLGYFSSIATAIANGKEKEQNRFNYKLLVREFAIKMVIEIHMW